ncbi:response regulator transcription factor [Ornithinimicrobium cryptoxanthini]|uniref:response regulator transcription factor n=1 Tax=Ornithinimicrobium cryptoxanthini TaxID=2934161 RepID=UPI0021194CCE|nr:response regulator transcription factor [Ornithinimicrobium cryptoxanthini]
MTGTRVLVVDDHPTFRRGVRALLERLDDVVEVEEAETGEQALEALASAPADVVMMDLLMPGIGGLAATQQIVDRHPGVAVLVTTMSESEDAVYRALRAGARGYLLKDAAPDTMVAAVRAVAGGQMFLDAKPGDRLSAYFGGIDVLPAFPELTEREREVLDLLAAGLDNAAIGGRLSLSPKTIRNYVSVIFAKLGLSGRSEAIIMARDAGLGS